MFTRSLRAEQSEFDADAAAGADADAICGRASHLSHRRYASK